MSKPNDLFEGLIQPPVVRPPVVDTEYRRIHVNFLNEADVARYAQLIGRAITAKTRELWFPEHDGSTITELFDIETSRYYEQPRSKIGAAVDDDLNSELFDYDYEPGFYELHWQNMPEFTQPNAGAARKITHYFKTKEDVKRYANLIDQRIGGKTNSIWWPYRPKNSVSDLYWISR